MALSKRDRRAIIMGVSALAVMAGYLLVLRPALRSYRNLVGEHEAATRALNRRIDEHRKAEFLAVRVKEWEAKAGSLLPPKPYSEQIAVVGERIVAAAEESRLQMQGTTPTAATPWPNDPQVAQAIVQIEAKADWENVFKFLAAVYRIPGVVSVEQLDLSGEGKGGGSLKVRMSISVIVAPTSENRWAS